MKYISVTIFLSISYAWSNSLNEKCLNREFQAEFLVRNGCRSGHVESCEIVSAASEMGSYRAAGIAAYLGGIWSTYRIMKATRTVEEAGIRKTYGKSFYSPTVTSIIDDIDQLVKTDPNKAGFDSEKIDETRKSLRARLEAIEKHHSSIEAKQKDSFGRKIEKMDTAHQRLEIHKKLDQVISESLRGATPYGKIQLEDVRAEFNKNSPDLKTLKGNLLKGYKAGQLKLKTRWIGPGLMLVGGVFTVGMPAVQPIIMESRATNSGVQLTYDNASKLKDAIYFLPSGGVSVNSEGLARLFEKPEDWKKLLDESPGLCGALIKDNDDSKKILLTEISNLKCGMNGSTWMVKTSRGEERVSVETISDAVRFQTSLYSIDISHLQSGVFFSQPTATNGTPFSVGDLKTDKIADFYSKNLALCSKPTGVENINRCKLGEDLILNLQILPKVLEKCSNKPEE